VQRARISIYECTEQEGSGRDERERDQPLEL
jgi:hypothetical protein